MGVLLGLQSDCLSLGKVLEDCSSVLALAFLDPVMVQAEGNLVDGLPVASHMIRIHPGLF